jgi:TRAP-type C4-dicarboxylate transport system permease small subunit
MRPILRAILRSAALLLAALVLVMLVWLGGDTRTGLDQPPTLVQQLARIGIWIYLVAIGLIAGFLIWRQVRRRRRH